MADFSCTAVLIVRDEETVLQACLQSLRPLVDEIVVLDTGSRDGTREVARRAGAHLLEMDWPDDFAVARNEAIAHATGRWILSIDADERVLEGDRQQLMTLLAADTATVGYRVWLRPGPLFTRYRCCRLFRNDLGIRFEGRICESVLPAVRRLSAENGAPLLGDSDLALEHTEMPGARLRKHERNLSLLRQAIREDGDRGEYWTELGRALVGLGAAEEARNAWWHAVALVRGGGAGSASDSLPYTDLLEQIPQGSHSWWELMEEASGRFPENPLLVWLRVRGLMTERRFAAAEPLLRTLADTDSACESCSVVACDRRIFNEFAWAALGVCCSQLGRWGEAAAWFARAEAAHPASLEYRARHALARRRWSAAAAQ